MASVSSPFYGNGLGSEAICCKLKKHGIFSVSHALFTSIEFNDTPLDKRGEGGILAEDTDLLSFIRASRLAQPRSSLYPLHKFTAACPKGLKARKITARPSLHPGSMVRALLGLLALALHGQAFLLPPALPQQLTLRSTTEAAPETKVDELKRPAEAEPEKVRRWIL
jgi:hypothetical protein